MPRRTLWYDPMLEAYPGANLVSAYTPNPARWALLYQESPSGDRNAREL